jgi:hypothetical protein
MKSLMVESLACIADKENYSDLQVMHSAAGFYIGTCYYDPVTGPEPGSRDSVEYYSTRTEAQDALNNNMFTQRDHP